MSAAHLSVPVVGILAGRRLDNLRRHTAASHAVVVMEKGVPIPASSGRGLAVRLAQWQSARRLAQAFAGFDHVTLVRVGPLDIPAGVEARLVRAADEVIDGVDAPGRGPAGVTPLGPVETPRRERPSQIAALVVRRLLGRRADGFRARAAAVRAALRRAHP